VSSRQSVNRVILSVVRRFALRIVPRSRRTPRLQAPTAACQGFSPIRNRLSCKQHLRSPLFCTICPPRVHRLNQCDLLLSSPALQLFFAPNRFADVDRSGICLKPFDLTSLVLPHSSGNIVGDADVQRTRTARDDVDPELVFHVRIPLQLHPSTVR
jgi:hypothetical protein